MIKYINKEADFTESRTACYMVAFNFSDYELIRKLKFIKFKCKLKSVAFTKSHENGLTNVYFLQNSNETKAIQVFVKIAFEESPEMLSRVCQTFLDKELNQ